MNTDLSDHANYQWNLNQTPKSNKFKDLLSTGISPNKPRLNYSKSDSQFKNYAKNARVKSNEVAMQNMENS